MEPEGDGAQFGFVGWVVLAAFCVGVIFVTDHVVDYLQGRHDHDTPVWIQGDWLVGEYRDCEMRTKTEPKSDDSLDALAKLPRLFCGDDSNGLVDFQREVNPALQGAQSLPYGYSFDTSVTAETLDRYFHTLPVRYFGRIDRQDKLVVSWRCQRNSGSLTCKALD